MLKVPETPEDLPVPPECRATVERIQRALDGETSLDTDTHTAVCTACRERLRAARILLTALAMPEPVAVPSGFADRVLAAVAADRQAEPRRAAARSRFARVTAWAALAAAIVVGVFYLASRQPEPKPDAPRDTPVETAKPPEAEVAPPPREKTPDPAPTPRPIRFGDEFAKAGDALRDAPKSLTDSVAVAPKILDAFTGPFKNPGPPPDPMATVLEPARKSIAEIPVAARTGLEPVTGTAEKALNRFLRDVGAVKPNS